MRWAEPFWLILLTLAAVPWLVEWRGPRLAWPGLALFPKGFGRVGALRRWVPPALRSAALACLVLALARPQTVAGQIRVAGRGLAIALVFDRSSSMTAIEPDAGGGGRPRIESARLRIDEFIQRRPDDLIGLVAFANYPDLLCPPTLDHETLRAALAEVGPAGAIEDGTNIGDAVAWACESLGPTRAIRRVVILLTDGANDPAVPDPLDPLEAADLARGLGITLHTIAVGRAGGLVHGVEPSTNLPVAALGDGPDLDLLAGMAERGGGRAFQAAAPDDLVPVFEELDRLERSPISGFIRTRYRERFGAFAAIALGLFAVDRLIAASRGARIP